MNLIETFQDLVARVPEFVQPLIVALAGAIPFIEGEGAAGIGIIGGIHPVIAVIAAVVGNFACVAVLVMLTSGTRKAVVTRHRARGAAFAADTATVDSVEAADTGAAPVSTRSQKFQRALERYGVPGVSLLGPLLLPTQFTATMLAATGVSRGRILLWQGIAILGWTIAVAALIGAAVYAVG